MLIDILKIVSDARKLPQFKMRFKHINAKKYGMTFEIIII